MCVNPDPGDTHISHEWSRQASEFIAVTAAISNKMHLFRSQFELADSGGKASKARVNLSQMAKCNFLR